MDLTMDRMKYGALFRAARKLGADGKYDRAARLVEELNNGGIEVGLSTIYAIEQGRQPISLELHRACLVLLAPRDGEKWFAPAFGQDARLPSET